MNRRHFFKWAVLATGLVQLDPTLELDAVAPSFPVGPAPSPGERLPEYWELMIQSREDPVRDGLGFEIAVVVYPPRYVLKHTVISVEVPVRAHFYGVQSVSDLRKNDGLPDDIARLLPPDARFLKAFPTETCWASSGMSPRWVPNRCKSVTEYASLGGNPGL